MHIDHKAGDKMYIDFTGQKLSIVPQTRGEIIEVEVFVAILGCSQLTYVEAVTSQKKDDLIATCENALHYFEGVPQAVEPDSLNQPSPRAVNTKRSLIPSLHPLPIIMAQP